MSHAPKRRRVEWPKSIGGASVMDFFLSSPTSFLTVGQEIARRKHWMHLRESYADLVAEHLGEHFTLGGDDPAPVPRESFNRWLFSPSSKGLKNELLEDIPVKIPHAFPSQKEEQMENTRIMAEALQKWMKQHESDEQTAQWCASVLAGEVGAENNTELRFRARSIVAKRATPAIERIASELTNLRDKGPQSDCGEEWEVEANFDSAKNRFVVSAVSDHDEMSFPINIWNYVRLALQFEGVQKIWNASSVAMPTFDNALFCLLCRYDALCGPGECEGRGLHGTLPQEFFEVIGAEVTECFASPLNAWRPSADRDLRFFCSFFQEDRCFGSLGSFFDPKFEPTAGLFEINPPFDCEVMESVIRRVDAWLSRAAQEDQKLAFIIVFPEWQPSQIYSSSPIQTLLASSHLRATSVRRPHQHFYLHGRSWSFGGKSSADCPRPRKAVSKSRLAVLASNESDDYEVLVNELEKSWALKT